MNTGSEALALLKATLSDVMHTSMEENSEKHLFFLKAFLLEWTEDPNSTLSIAIDSEQTEIFYQKNFLPL